MDGLWGLGALGGSFLFFLMVVNQHASKPSWQPPATPPQNNKSHAAQGVPCCGFKET
jgi:hypothetical protein